MKYTFFKAFIAVILFPATLLPAAGTECTEPRSLRNLCFEAAVFRYAQPSEGLGIDTDSTLIAMAADFTSVKDKHFTKLYKDAISDSVTKLSKQHNLITDHFSKRGDGYKETNPPAWLSADGIDSVLPELEKNLRENTFTIDDCKFLLYQDSLECYYTRLKSLSELQSKVDTHFSRLCEDNIDPKAASIFDKQKTALIETISAAIHHTREHLRKMQVYNAIKSNMCNTYNIQQKLEQLLRAEAVAPRTLWIDQEALPEGDQQGLQEQAPVSNALRIAKHELLITRRELLQVALPTAILTAAGTVYMHKIGYKEGPTWKTFLACFAPPVYCLARSLKTILSNDLDESGPAYRITYYAFFGIIQTSAVLLPSLAATHRTASSE